jgi:hypothetical protein
MVDVMAPYRTARVSPDCWMIWMAKDGYRENFPALSLISSEFGSYWSDRRGDRPTPLLGRESFDQLFLTPETWMRSARLTTSVIS